MARDGMLILDSDLHLIEPADLWQRYMPAEWRDQAPMGTTAGPRAMSLEPDSGLGEISPPNFNAPEWWGPGLVAHTRPIEHLYQFAEDRKFDAVSQLEAMDQEGIDIAVCFPSRGLFVLGFDLGTGPGKISAPFATAIARAYNDWLHDFMSTDPTRLLGAAMVAPHDVDGAVAETRRVVELGFKTIFLLPGIVAGRPWHHPDYDPLWQVCQELEIPVSFHGGGPDWLTDFALGHRREFMIWHSFSHSLGPISALASVLCGGILDRFPNLKAAFLEANCSWAPWLVHRFDEHYAEYTGRFELPLKRLPSEAFVQNCWVSVEADEKPADLYVQALGDDNVVFSTDYPHPDAKFPHAVDAFLGGNLSAETKRKILWDNCARLYRVEVPATAAAAPNRGSA